MSTCKLTRPTHLQEARAEMLQKLTFPFRSQQCVIALRGHLVGRPYFMDRRESYSNSTSSVLRGTYEYKRTSSDSTRSGLLSSRVVEYMQSNKRMMIRQ